MKRSVLACGLLFVALGTSYGDDKAQPPAPTTAVNANLEKLKKLAGTWVLADAQGKPTDQVVSVFKVTAGGSAVLQTLFPDQPHEMLSIYTAEGQEVLLTHYCVLGNQPRMKAGPKTAADVLEFKFIGGANLDPAKDKHMHEGKLTFIDDDHIVVGGVGWENGEPMKGETCGPMKLVRKK